MHEAALKGALGDVDLLFTKFIDVGRPRQLWGCHNGARPAPARYFRPPPPLDFWLRVASLTSPATTPTYQTALDEYVVPGAPEASPLFRRFVHSSWFLRRMPPLATEVVDPNGLRLLERWIRELPAPGTGHRP